MTSAEKSVSEPPNMKIFWGTIPPYPPTRLVPSALTIISPPLPPHPITCLRPCNGTFVKVLLKRFYLSGHTVGFHPHSLKSKNHLTLLTRRHCSLLE